MKILIIDDSKSVHALVHEMLEENKVIFSDVYNGKEGVFAVQASSFDADLIMLDWEMPEMSGIEALPELRKAQPDVPILMTTTKNAISDIVNALEKGATDYLMKPFTKDILLGKINQMLGNKGNLK